MVDLRPYRSSYIMELGINEDSMYTLSDLWLTKNSAGIVAAILIDALMQVDIKEDRNPERPAMRSTWGENILWSK